MTYLETIEQALLALEDLGMKHYENTGEVLYKQTVEALRQVREQAEPKCNPHPKAPHGFNRNASHSNERYTCECEGWDAYEAGYQDGLQKGFEMEQAQQAEPVALKKGECWPEDVMQMWDNYRKEIANGHTGSEPRDWFESLAEMRLVDTSTPPRQPLSDEEIAKCYETTGHCQTLRPQDRFAVFALARAIEAAHGIRESQ